MSLTTGAWRSTLLPGGRTVVRNSCLKKGQWRSRLQGADTTEAWLRALRERVEEVEGDTPEAFRARRRLVKLLVQSISAGKRPDDGRTEIQVTYRFGPPSASEVRLDQSSVGPFKNGSRS